MDAWQLVIEERFQEAVDLLTAHLSARPATYLYNNRGMAYLHLGEFKQAYSDFCAADKISRKEGDGESDGAMSGVALWMSGE